MFQIAQNTQVNLINLTFTNTTSYLIKNNGITNIFNSTFKDIDGKAIKNVGNLKLINTTFENINPNYKNPQAIYSVNYDDTGIIYNNGNLQINDGHFNNIYLPKQVKIGNKSMIEEGLIYNLEKGCATISNT